MTWKKGFDEEKAAAKTDALATIAPGHEDDPSGAGKKLTRKFVVRR